MNTSNIIMHSSHIRGYVIQLIAFSIFIILIVSLFSCTDDWDPPIPEIAYHFVVVDSILIGIGEGDSLLWLPSQVEFTPDGNIAFLDKLQHCIKIYSIEGKYVTTIGGYGEGPGELYLPRTYVFFPEGELLVLDADNLTYYNENYEYIDRIEHLGMSFNLSQQPPSKKVA